MRELLKQNEKSWNANSKFYFGTTALPIYGCNLESEEKLNLFENIERKSILEIGFGSGHSLHYLSKRNPSELWGVDISENQKKAAVKLLENSEVDINLFTSAMEDDPGLPLGHFDIVFSIYALGWTLDLDKTLNNIASYLKIGGFFIFSWDHPFMHCIDEINTQLQFTGNYHDEDLFSWDKNDNRMSLINRKFSTYVNSLFKAGFMIETLIEESTEEDDNVEFASAYYSKTKFKHFPLSFIMKARKIR